MTNERAIEIIQTEKKCVAKANICGRDCANCDLVLPEKEILEAYDMSISALTSPFVPNTEDGTLVVPEAKMFARIVNAAIVSSLDEEDDRK